MAKVRILDEAGHTTCEGSGAGGVLRVTPDSLEAALGWSLKPQGLCRGDVCIPVAGQPGLVDEGGIDVARFAGLLGRAVAVDVEERVASLGASARARGETLRSGIAPDFSLPDLDGNLHSLSAQGGRKVLLIAYASW